METVAGLPYPRLSCNRFSFELRDSAEAHEFGSMALLSDDALFDACSVRIAFSGREGGVSVGPYASLNLGTHVDDSEHLVLQNRRRLQSALGARSASLIVPKQVHGTDIVSVSRLEDLAPAQDRASCGADGVEVLCEDVAALLCFADCMPVILVAPSGAFAVVHAGWRGVYGHIAVSALKSLVRKTECAADECNIYLGPFIHPECFEVSEDLAEKFAAEFGASCMVDRRHVDLEMAIRGDLIAAGACPQRIVSAGICTVCNPGDYYSYRASGGVCGRHGAIAVRVPKSTRDFR